MLSNNHRATLRHLGNFTRIPSFLCLPTFVVIVVFGEWFALPAFLLLFLFSFGIGWCLTRWTQPAETMASSYSLLLISISWLLIPALGLIPYYGVALSGHTGAQMFLDLNSAAFESMSGFSGTGLSMVAHPQNLPHCLQWWRSLTEWTGSMGVLFVALIYLHHVADIDKIYHAETNSFQIDDNYRQTILTIWWMYLAFTLVAVILFFVLGMPFWEALNHGLAAICTGGFSVRDNSFSDYSFSIRLAANFVIVIGAISFKVYYLLLLKRDIKGMWRQTQLRYFLALLIVLTSVILYLNSDAHWLDNTFQLTSALSTCGLNTANVAKWQAPVLFLLTIAMNLGGNANSTAGGIKTARIAWLLKSIRQNLREALQTEENKKKFCIDFNGEKQKEERVAGHVQNAMTILFLWLLSLVAGCVLLSIFLPPGVTFMQTLFEVSSALNNVGLSAGVTAHSLSAAGKWILIFLMWMGRLEVFAVLVLFYSVFRVGKTF